MELLFRREQTSGRFLRVKFKLWAKVELTPDEKEIVRRYRLAEALLIVVLQPAMLQRALIYTIVIFVLSFGFLAHMVPFYLSLEFVFFLSLAASGGFAYWYINEQRETIWVKDLLHGRHFICNSVVDLAKKEAWLYSVVGLLRQVMESAKHWDGTEHHEIHPLPPEAAKQAIVGSSGFLNY